ncbi:zonular occludens toxin domain-containing protein [Sulfurospirillum halorespirans]|uniref:Zona occludens toxin domain-containing protein n=1 Tax=Sulfurospirillum halorespirans DSM 13726 TaxID=1193502 RepID=A0A1D7THT8_9BACT|nr:zonular occludens toxin domain-containing protein [Sulfurospirillum halorespirans]AOO64561.1 zona occludens toxin domain-containing protein [Sulfurospirillum halorespirans DSM 13726]
MAITYLTGIPRSGKTYYAMFLLYMAFIFVIPVTKLTKLLDKFFGKYSSKKLKKTYDIAYTNINQFDFSKSSKIKPFDYSAFYAHLVNLHTMYTAKKTDDELIYYAKANNLFNALFVIDECQNFFDKENLILTWWLTYHGHLHQDIIFITQNLDLIFTGYTKIAEFFYKAVPPSSRFFSNKFRYVQYNSYKCYQKDKIGDFHVPMVPEIFKMYVSGASNNAPSQVKKYLMYFIILFVLLVIVFKVFLSQFDTEKTETINQEKSEHNKSMSLQPENNVTDQGKKQTSKDAKKFQKQDVNDTKDELFEIRCIDMLCTYKGIDFPKPLLNKLTLKLEPEFIWFFNDGSYIQYFVMLPSDTFDFLQKIEKEKSIKENKNGAITSKEAKSSNPMPTAFATHK